LSGGIIVGIDPGVNTGYAELSTAFGKLVAVESLLIHQAMDRVRRLHLELGLRMVVYEDARLRRWYGAKGAEALQGAGSIKRDSTIWADFLTDLGCPTLAIKPQAGATKWDAATFARITGWTHRTNEHGRDAGCLIWGRK